MGLREGSQMLLPKAGTPIAGAPDYIPLPAKSPYDMNGETEAFISKKMLEHLERHGPTRKFFDAQSLPDVLESPTVIFGGLQRTPFGAGFCYSCVPTCRWFDDQSKMPLPPWKVFLAYVFPLGEELFVLDWNWRFCDQSRSGYPKNWQKDYGRQVWPPTS
jgi:hypothetical protein